MGNSYLNEGRPTFYAAAQIKKGQLCVLDADCKLTPATTALLATNKATAMIFASTDAGAGEPASGKLVGSAPGSVLALAKAGTYAPGAPVYAADGGMITATAGTRQIGVYLGKSATVEDGAAVEVAPVFVVLS